MAVAAGAALQWWRTRPLPPFPAPEVVAHARPRTAAAEFAGATACAECHADQHAAWQMSTHGVAGGTPPAHAPVHAFNGSPIRFADGVVIPGTRGDGALRFTVQQQARQPVTFEVVAIVGAAAMHGGGTQAYLTRHVDGTVRVLPWEQTRDGEWFCNTDTRAQRGWQPITADMRLADCGDWPPRRVLGSHEKLAHCQECHGSGIDSDAVMTRWRSLAIDCESCHGPARAHIDSVRAGRGGGIASLLTLDKEQSVRLCLRCHALKDALPGAGAGAAYDTARYSIGMAVLTGEDVFADGRARTFAYQEGHLYSACYLNGGMTCVDCHAPHDQTYRSFQGATLSGRFDDAQCTGCHASKTQDVTAHTRHAVDSPGSRCTSCHMPYLQQPVVGSRIRYARSDHTISVPRPELDSILGIRGACASCHPTLSDGELARTLRTWHGEPKPLPRAVAAAVTDGGIDALPDILSQRMAQPMTTLAVLGRALRHAARDSAYVPDRAVRRALADAARAPDADIAAAALALLHYTHGTDRRTRGALVHALRTHPQATAVRARWVTLLGWLGDRHAEADEQRRAARTYELALQLDGGHGATLRSLGYARLRLGDNAGAVESFRAAVRARSDDALAHIGLGVALAAGGEEDAAAAAYRAALAADAAEPLAHLNLGNGALRAGRHMEAARWYQRALELDPALSAAHFNLARAHLAVGDYNGAAAAIRRGLELEPANDAAARMLAQLQAAGYGGRP